MKTKKFVSLCLSSLIAISSFQSAAYAKTGIRITSFDPTVDTSTLSTGIVYFLPKSIGKATYTYDLWKISKTFKNPADPTKNITEINFSARVDSAPTIEILAQPDEKLGFEINPSNLKGFSIATTIEGISISENGILTGINSKFDGRLPQMVKGLTESAINIAKIAAMTAMAASMVDPNAVQLKEEKIKSITISNYFDLDKGTDYQANTVRPDYGNASLTERSDIKEAYKEFKINSELMNDTLRSYVEQNGGNPVIDLPDAKIPDIVVRLKGNMKKQRSSKEILGDKGRFDGIVVRTPANAKLETHLLFKVDGKVNEDIPLNEEFFPIAQCGIFSELKMDSNPFYSKDYKISLSNTGAISKYGYTGGSLGESLTTMLSDVTKQAAAAPTDVMGAQAELLKKQAEILDARAKIQKLQNDLDELNKKKGAGS